MTFTNVVVHSFDDNAYELMPQLQAQPYFNIDVRGVPGNELFNEAVVADMDIPQLSSDFIALSQYRRVLMPDIEKLDVLKHIACVHVEPQPLPLAQIWVVYHCIEFLSQFSAALHGISPSLGASFRDFMTSTQDAKHFCARNAFCLRHQDFLRWKRFMSTMMQLMVPLVKRMQAGMFWTDGKDIWQDRYQKRQPGFLCERLTAFWLQKLSGLELVDTAVRALPIDSPYQRMKR